MTDDPNSAVPYIVQMGQVSASAIDTQVLPADPKRRVMLLTNGLGTGQVTVVLRSPDSNGFQHILIAGVYTEFSYRKHGPAVFEALFTGNLPSTGIVSWLTVSEV